MGRGRGRYYYPEIRHCKKSPPSVSVGLGYHNKARKPLQSFRGVNMAAGVEVTAVDLLINWMWGIRERNCGWLQDGSLAILNMKARMALDSWTFVLPFLCSLHSDLTQSRGLKCHTFLHVPPAPRSYLYMISSGLHIQLSSQKISLE